MVKKILHCSSMFVSDHQIGFEEYNCYCEPTIHYVNVSFIDSVYA